MYQSAKYPPILKRANILNEASSSPPLIAMLVLTSVVVSAEVTSNADLDDCTDDDVVVARVARAGLTNGACLAEAVAASRARARMGERMVLIIRLVGLNSGAGIYGL